MIVYANHESLAMIDVSKEIMPMKKKSFVLLVLVLYSLS